MGTLLIILHVLTAVLFLGPVTVAVSSFQSRAVEAHNGNATAQGSALTLYKITQTYGMLSLLVPLIGFAVMFTNDNYWADGRFHASIALAVVAWAVLIFLIMPRQKKLAGALGLLEADELEAGNFEVADWNKAKGQLSMFGGIFSLLWVIIAVLMVL
ncbi:Hypothetical protein Cul210931_0863 [Corynebacterium ulcerans]|uniref:DUF2269 domain-containing protein n=1 Tax=Corynebacterium ulcerans FRC58 TaxID=1408268 RepID=A0ABM5U106_CORUL|nr:hypothetical protein [Corynebacterium ulcerans]AIU30217.1 Hypothetical protein Cul210931_0863 [Corynebacterium ulcerans]AIU91502.1 Hypothetical protein Cul05146_0924 [Corynebacterium ulcerans]AKN76794.1 Hypothetical protein CulFRC58_0940 [Corynebacterium ulcerans FRC58]NOL61769.1 DUF2269 domain-containing protein [Corynebacterium ulcerans]NON17005.1 DUF2269 domain-containing protein [Corynebacterium ulcerans]